MLIRLLLAVACLLIVGSSGVSQDSYSPISPKGGTTSVANQSLSKDELSPELRQRLHPAPTFVATEPAASPKSFYSDIPTGCCEGICYDASICGTSKTSTVAYHAALDSSLNYPSWTHPGDVRNHLFDAEHSAEMKAAGYTYEQVRAMTPAQAKILHNRLHNAERKGVTQQVKTQSYSSCPGGNCPSGVSSGRTWRLFGGRFRGR